MQTFRSSLVMLMLCAFSHLSLAQGFRLEDGFDNQSVSDVSISPDGKHLAILGSSNRNRGVIIMDADTRESRMVVAGDYLRRPSAARWITNDLIAVRFYDEAFSFDLQGKRIAELGVSVLRKSRPSDPNSTLVLVTLLSNVISLAEVDAKTGATKKFSFPMSGELMNWAFDDAGRLRAVTLKNVPIWTEGTTVTNWYLPDAGGDWVQLAQAGIAERYWVPVAILADDKMMISSNIGRNTRAMFSYDTRSRQIGEMLIGHPDEDLDSVRGSTLSNPSLVITAGMKPERYWLEPRWSAAQRSVDNALPGRINALSGDPKGRLLVLSWSDVDPGSWYLFDMKESKFELLVRSAPKIDPEKMRKKEILSYAARDGLRIPAYLTRPAESKGAMPTVVLIHGGPWVRDGWEWDLEVQLLAAHGYAVFQPQFRGSSGFGRNFMEAGFGQWGLAMQDDITDGVQYLIGKGIADPQRICIYGGSYGGYAALWGMVKTPQLYRCGISFAGVSDIGNFLSGGSDINRDIVGRELARAFIGDIKQKAQQFDAVSPLKHADQVQAPILLIHGSEDQRVPVSHARNMAQALQSAGKPYEFKVLYTGHGLGDFDSHEEFYGLLFGFLDKYIGSKPSPAGDIKTEETSAQH